MFGSAKEIIDFVNRESIEYIDARFCDLFGIQQHFTIPAHQLPGAIRDGLMFDGSSIRGFTAIHESDMKLVADPSTAFVDPFRIARTLVVVFSIVDPFTDEPFSRDPRQVARKAEAYMKASGIADTCYVGAEAEFYVFDDVRFQVQPNNTFYAVDSVEGHWNTGKKEEGGSLGHKVAPKGGYFPVSPTDHFADLRDVMANNLKRVGMTVERAHHEVGSGGQQEVNYRFDSLLHAADDLLKFKYVIKNTAREAGKSATFMPKPLAGDNGSGMHTNLSLWKDGKPLFYSEEGYAGLSETALWFVGGILKHAPALAAFTNPTVNSYRRLIPGFEAPTNLVYSARNRSAAMRIPITGRSAAAKRVEYRVPDASANPYLAFTGCLMAGLDGIVNQIEPPAPVNKDLYELTKSELAEIATLPTSLEDACKALEADHDFLLAGGVFTQDLIDTWLDYKYRKEVAPMRIYPHPYEYQLYYSV